MIGFIPANTGEADQILIQVLPDDSPPLAVSVLD
jgi:hypothetical protein